MKTAQKGSTGAKATAKATAEATKATVRATIAAVKAIIAGTKALISALIAGGWIAVVIILIVVLLGCAVSLFGGGSGSNAYTPVSAEVEAYEPLIQKYAKQYGISEYVELIKAVMMQESGGRGLDPMQAAEGSFNTRYPHEPNGIQDPEYSIECGVQELKAALISAEVENPIDMEHIKLALQGYNFGNGYISWAKTNYGGYSYANAVEFSTMQAARLGWNSYGDTQYPAHVAAILSIRRAFTSGGNQAIVEVALTQLGNEAVSLIGVGTALRGVWNGVPALCHGVLTSVVISKAGLSRNSQAAWTAQIGLRVTDNGKTETTSRRQAILFSLIGKATVQQTTLVS